MCWCGGFSVPTRWFSDNSRTLTPRFMKLHRYIDHDWQMTPIAFQVTRSKFKVTIKEKMSEMKLKQNNIRNFSL
ncbi:hypothetical protein DPMN_095113 [Dreissena polymorpha]|uniref:Uncharacterized protein n=1 Tax=Dreissena polymorpha TaxID=45954 RepID=A0A9D4R2F7_DREPO|nr:hypothetical protein DPMN_095113 [Dreissena polymorpha]